MKSTNEYRAPRTVEDDGALLTIDEVADFLRLPLATLYAWRHKGVGPSALRVGRHLRYRRADLLRWLTEQ